MKSVEMQFIETVIQDYKMYINDIVCIAQLPGLDEQCAFDSTSSSSDKSVSEAAPVFPAISECDRGVWSASWSHLLLHNTLSPELSWSTHVTIPSHHHHHHPISTKYKSIHSVVAT